MQILASNNRARLPYNVHTYSYANDVGFIFYSFFMLVVRANLDRRGKGVLLLLLLFFSSHVRAVSRI